MQNKVNELTQGQLDELQIVTDVLVGRYQPESLFCFGGVKEDRAGYGCFRGPFQQSVSHYFLLMVTNETTRKEIEVQDYVNSHVSGMKITIIVHGKSSVRQAIRQGSAFFIEVYNTGHSLYPVMDTRPALKCTHVQTEKRVKVRIGHFYDHYGIAAGFLLAADCCSDREYYHNALFMLHQTVEHACIALIRLFMGYRPATHNIVKSLNLCLCFSDEPLEFFHRRSAHEKRLFTLLCKGYSARYDTTLEIDNIDVDELRIMLHEFLDLVTALGNAKAEELERSVESGRSTETGIEDTARKVRKNL